MPNEKKSILQPKNDVVFKALFSRGKPRITQAMLEAILKMKIDKLELDKSTDLLNDNKDDKNGRLDLRAVINGNTECDIEVQLASNDNIAERFVYYWAKMYAANLKIGDTYSDLRKTISIIILDDVFKLTKNLENPQTTWKIRENEELHLILTDYFEIIIIELPKVVKAYHKTPNDEVLQWMLFLDNPEKEEVSRIMEENKDIKEAKEELDRISQDDLLRRRVLNRTLEIADQLQMKKELEEARKELEEAKKEAQQAENEKENIIKNLHKLNIPIEQISKAVNLSEKEIKKLTDKDLEIEMKKEICGTILIVVAISLFIVLYKDIFDIAKKNYYNTTLDKLLKDYGDVIVELNSEINKDGLQVVEVKNFNEMLDLEEELKIPIMFYEIEEDELGEFTINHNNIIYRYILKDEER